MGPTCLWHSGEILIATSVADRVLLQRYPPTSMGITVYWCQRHKLLSDSKNCARCGAGMNLVKQKDVSCGLGWRCTRKRCRKELALRSGTFFEGQQEMIMIMINDLLTLYT